VTPCATLVWTPNDIRVLTSHNEFKMRFAVAADQRYSLRLSSDHAGRLYLRAVQDRQPFWISVDKGIDFGPIPPIPGEHPSISAYSCKVHPSAGVVSALEHGLLWMHTVTTSHWQPRELPSDIHVRDVSLDGQGGLWCTGSVDSRRIPGEETEAAVRYQARPGAGFQPRSPRLRPIDAVRVIGAGGLAEFRTIDAESEPVVATSISSRLLDDSASFAFIFTPNRTYVRRLKGEMICCIDRSLIDTVRVFTHQGNIWENRGTGWKRRSIVPAIVKSLMIPKRQILVRGLDAWGEKIAAAVEVAQPGVGDIAQDPEFTATCLSTDGGVSFTVPHRLTFKNGGEIQDVALLT
jgi:hypothetical protein